MNIKELYTLFQKYPNIQTDSRNTGTNSIFFALKGERFDGNAYASQAILNGAEVAVIDNAKYSDRNTVLVHDTLQTLQELANYHRKNNTFSILAITGSNGKTTTKELIANILGKKYKCIATKGNLNNHIGVPLTLLSMTNNTEIGIVEMGANHSGEIQLLCNIAEPDYGMITNIGMAHLEGFGNVRNIIKAKGELYDYLIKNNRKIFIHSDNKILNRILPDDYKNTIPYGKNSGIISGKILSASPFLKVRITIDKKIYETDTHLFGDYNLENIIAAVCVANHFNIPDVDIIDGIKSYIPSNNRSQYIETKNNRIILDAYNANPTSMNHAIKNFASYFKGNKAVMLGEMLELGDYEKTEHQNLVDSLKQYSLGKIFLSGKRFMETKSAYNCFESVDDLKLYLKNHPVKDYTVLIKGSRANHMEDLIDCL